MTPNDAAFEVADIPETRPERSSEYDQIVQTLRELPKGKSRVFRQESHYAATVFANRMRLRLGVRGCPVRTSVKGSAVHIWPRGG